MVQKKELEGFKSPVLSPSQVNPAPNEINSQASHAQASTKSATYDFLTGTYETGRGMDGRIPYHQPTSAMDGTPDEQEDPPPLRAAGRVLRPDPVDDEPLSRAKMWDPVKDCSDPTTLHADLDNGFPARRISSPQFMNSTTGGVASIGPSSCHANQPHGHAQSYLQQFMTSGTRGASSMGLLPFPQSHMMASGYQGSGAIGLQPSQAGHPYEQHQPNHHHQSKYENVSILPLHLREPFLQTGQRSMESSTREASSMDIQLRQADYLHIYPQENRQQSIGIESRTPAPMASHKSIREHSSPYQTTQAHTASPSTSSNLSTQGRPDNLSITSDRPTQQHDCLQHPSPSANMSQALNLARYAESLDQESNFKEAMCAYEQACALFQEVIIRSASFEERMSCNDARNTLHARLDVLSQEWAASQRKIASERDDEQEEDDGLGRGKPQYSLDEDWALCHKEEEELSWQEVAETPLFKDKRKHRSLSQRKHTISKMGPKYHEAERPWTAEEDRKLCALGDDGKTLGDIHRKFRHRNAERCLNRYFQLKGYRPTSRFHTRTPHQAHQAHQAPALYPLGIQHAHSSSVTPRHSGYNSHSSTSVADPITHSQSSSTVLQQSYQVPPTSGQNMPSIFTPRQQTSGMTAPPSSFTSAELANYSTAPRPLKNAASTETLLPSSQGPSKRRSATPTSFSHHSDVGTSNSTTLHFSFDNPSSPEVVGNKSTDWRQRPTTSSSSATGSGEKSATHSSPSSSVTESPTTTGPPP